MDNIQKYERLISSLQKKLRKGQLSNKDSGYNEGIRCALSMIKAIYGDNTPNDNRSGG